LVTFVISPSNGRFERLFPVSTLPSQPRLCALNQIAEVYLDFNPATVEGVRFTNLTNDFQLP